MPNGKTERKPKELKEIVNPNRQLIAVKKISEIVRGASGKSLTIGKILRESGYSLQTSLHPSSIVQGDKFQALLEKHLPDDKLAETHELLTKAEFRGKAYFNKKISKETIKDIIESVSGCRLVRILSNKKGDGWVAYYTQPDSNSRLRAITEAYKLKNKYPAIEVKQETVVKFADLNDEELDEAIDAIEGEVIDE